jgi:dethiobiotin synthase
VRRLVVTGTDTGVGKTAVVTALALALPADHVVKPVQSGEPADVDEINRVVGRAVAQEWHRIAVPLAPETAARELGVDLPTVQSHVERLGGLSGTVVVEGSGGVAVRLDLAGHTIVDLAKAWDGEVVVVTRDTLGTLNHTALTAEYLRRRGVEPVLVLGAATAAGALNRRELERITGCRIVGSVPLGDVAGASFASDWL